MRGERSSPPSIYAQEHLRCSCGYTLQLDPTSAPLSTRSQAVLLLRTDNPKRKALMLLHHYHGYLHLAEPHTSAPPFAMLLTVKSLMLAAHTPGSACFRCQSISRSSGWDA